MFHIIQYCVLTLLLILSVPVARAQTLAVPVMERADTGDHDTCSVGKVTGLNPEGDNFLAVRAGPGGGYTMIDKLGPDAIVWIFETRGNWLGVVYGSDGIECSPLSKDRPYAGSGETGWVHNKFVRLLAG